MNLDEYKALRAPADPVKPEIGAMDDSTRTLLYGYDVSTALGRSDTVHVFQHEGSIHLVKSRPVRTGANSYDDQAIEHRLGKTLPIEDLIPSKRLYPEYCDFEFCEDLQKRGVSLPFTTFDESRSLDDKNGIAGFTDVPEIDEREPGVGMKI